MQQKCCDCFCGREQNPNIISQSASLHSSHTWSGRCNVWYWLISLVSAFQSTKTPGLKTHRVCQTYGPCVRTTVVSWWLQHVFCGFNLINVVSGRKHVTTVLKKTTWRKAKQCNLGFSAWSLNLWKSGMIPATPWHPENACKHYREDAVSFFFTHISEKNKKKN